MDVANIQCREDKKGYFLVFANPEIIIIPIIDSRMYIYIVCMYSINI